MKINSQRLMVTAIRHKLMEHGIITNTYGITASSHMLNILCVGGFDPSGASGVQRDVVVSASLGAHPLSVVTAITGQNTTAFLGTYPVPRSTIMQQLESILSDFDIHTVKIGMLWGREAMDAITDILGDLNVPIVLDPVVVSTTGGALLEESAKSYLIQNIIPMTSVITPNLQELAYLTDTKPHDVPSAENAVTLLMEMVSVPNVIVTGVTDGDSVVDIVCVSGESGVMHHYIAGERLDITNRGSGCTYSAALACHMAQNSGIFNAAKLAHRTAYMALSGTVSPGRGVPVVGNSLSDAGNLSLWIQSLCAVRGFFRLIPQCQTNFAYAPLHSTTPNEVLGVCGRIVRACDTAVVAGDVIPGGSHHVASAVCAIRGRFPHVRAAVNIQYSSTVLSAIIRADMAVAFYDRNQEPPDIKESGSSVAWGVSQAVTDAPKAPDAVCHKGDFGKEPMTIIFGTTPENVVSKIRRICHMAEYDKS